LHDPTAHVSIEGVIGGKYLYAVGPAKLFVFKSWGAHRKAKGLGFIAASNEAAVVVRQHGYGLSLQTGIKDPFAGGVKIITIYQRIHRVKLRAFS
jgi:hypothetical protein